MSRAEEGRIDDKHRSMPDVLTAYRIRSSPTFGRAVTPVEATSPASHRSFGRWGSPAVGAPAVGGDAVAPSVGRWGSVPVQLPGVTVVRPVQEVFFPGLVEQLLPFLQLDLGRVELAEAVP